MIRLNFNNETNSKISKAVFEKVFLAFVKILKNRIQKMVGKNVEVSLILIDDKKIKDINTKWRKKNKPTDVISFAYLEKTDSHVDIVDYKEKGIVGDIFISVDTAKKQAEEHKHNLNKELQILFTHGLLHLFGFDHKNDSQEKEMENWAKKILS